MIYYLSVEHYEVHIIYIISKYMMVISIKEGDILMVEMFFSTVIFNKTIVSKI